MLQMLLGASGAAGLEVNDAFSIDLWSGNGTSRTIENDIDLSTEGGLVWIKHRTVGYSHALFDTERGVLYGLEADSTTANTSQTNSLTSFTTEGYQLGSSSIVNSGTAGHNYVGWTFRKAKKFFDIVKYDGTGSAQTLSHNLESEPGMILVKRLNDTEDWAAYHTAVGNNHYIKFSQAYGYGGAGDNHWNQTTPTSTNFYVGGTDAMVNGSGASDNYVAYLFAKDGDFIKCGGWTGAATVNLGWQPQWLIVKRVADESGSASGNWHMFDTARGFTDIDDTNNGAALEANSNGQESASQYGIGITSTGFETSGGGFGNGTDEYIYIAIKKED